MTCDTLQLILFYQQVTEKSPTSAKAARKLLKIPQKLGNLSKKGGFHKMGATNSSTIRTHQETWCFLYAEVFIGKFDHHLVHWFKCCNQHSKHIKIQEA